MDIPIENNIILKIKYINQIVFRLFSKKIFIKNNNAFTIVELILVTSILGLLLGYVIPKLKFIEKNYEQKQSVIDSQTKMYKKISE